LRPECLHCSHGGNPGNLRAGGAGGYSAAGQRRLWPRHSARDGRGVRARCGGGRRLCHFGPIGSQVLRNLAAGRGNGGTRRTSETLLPGHRRWRSRLERGQDGAGNTLAKGVLAGGRAGTKRPPNPTPPRWLEKLLVCALPLSRRDEAISARNSTRARCKALLQTSGISARLRGCSAANSIREAKCGPHC